jgi:hypothetical protein
MDTSMLLTVFALTLAVFGAGVAAMAIGNILTGRCLRGSCGGSEVTGPKGERLSCADCPNRHGRERSGLR